MGCLQSLPPWATKTMTAPDCVHIGQILPGGARECHIFGRTDRSARDPQAAPCDGHCPAFLEGPERPATLFCPEMSMDNRLLGPVQQASGAGTTLAGLIGRPTCPACQQEAALLDGLDEEQARARAPDTARLMTERAAVAGRWHERLIARLFPFAARWWARRLVHRAIRLSDIAKSDTLSE